MKLRVKLSHLKAYPYSLLDYPSPQASVSVLMSNETNPINNCVMSALGYTPDA